MSYHAELDLGETPTPRRLLVPTEITRPQLVIFNTLPDLADLLALADEIEDTEGVDAHAALVQALRMWRGLEIDIAADVRYLPHGESIRAHVSIAAGVPLQIEA